MAASAARGRLQVLASETFGRPWREFALELMSGNCLATGCEKTKQTHTQGAGGGGNSGTSREPM